MSQPHSVLSDDVLAGLACDLGARPAGAPHFAHVADRLLAVRREPGALVADFDAAAAPTLEQLVDAERRCCADIGWHLERIPAPGPDTGAVVRLRVEGTAAQLDAAALLIRP